MTFRNNHGNEKNSVLVTLPTGTTTLDEQIMRRTTVRTLFEPWNYRFDRSSIPFRCGEFLNALLGVIAAEPSYILKEDIPWILSMLVRLRDGECQNCRLNGPPKRQRIADVPIDDLSWVLRQWFQDSFRNSRFMTIERSRAIAVIEIVKAHWRGKQLIYEMGHCTELVGARDCLIKSLDEAIKKEATDRNQKKHWESLFFSLNERVDHEFAFLSDPAFKSEHTQEMKSVPLVMEVPLGEKLTIQVKPEIIFGSGRRFIFVVTRGHLSFAQDYDYPQFTIEKGDSDSSLNLLKDYCVFGNIPNIKKYNWWNGGSFNKPQGYIPMRWCRGIVDFVGRDQELVELPEYLRISFPDCENTEWPFGMKLERPSEW